MLFVENYFWLNDLKLVRIAVSLFLRIVIINQDYREKKNPVVQNHFDQEFTYNYQHTCIIYKLMTRNYQFLPFLLV